MRKQPLGTTELSTRQWRSITRRMCHSSYARKEGNEKQGSEEATGLTEVGELSERSQRAVGGNEEGAVTDDGGRGAQHDRAAGFRQGARVLRGMLLGETGQDVDGV